MRTSWFAQPLSTPGWAAPGGARLHSLGFAAVSAGTVRVQNDLCPSVVAGVEVVVRHCRIIEVQLVRDQEARLCLAARDKVAQRPVVPLHRRLPRADLLALEPHHAEIDRHGTLPLASSSPWASAPPGSSGRKTPTTPRAPVSRTVSINWFIVNAASSRPCGSWA